ncbi:MAG: hypothetical protein LBS70_04185 [Candidatus Accumulibacter sp.]|nr:hypothetical protein [Accumulibacter sp.]
MTLKSEIEAWDGQSLAALRRIHERHWNEPNLALELADLLGSLRCRRAAARILKRHFEAGLTVRDPPGVARRLFARLAKLEHWESRLDILQCLPYLPIEEKEAEAVAGFLRACLADANRFVRAWAYSGFHDLARRHPRFAAAAQEILSAGLRKEPASVKSKIRECLGMEGLGLTTENTESTEKSKD